MPTRCLIDVFLLVTTFLMSSLWIYYGWMNVNVNELSIGDGRMMDGCSSGWLDGLMDKWIGSSMDGWKENVWMVGWLDSWMDDGRMD